ncbi:hypothetical protein W822_19100 [Advenella kashmirensis W13003]|uniref:Uncharacterized protein n=1 Tax=Advenella kashmirensis W13003 TaxID=1424334 RepID=V8QN70_9BURK|nr:hypothetical protein [Advenella kashmirensis]ETF01426.1 hypothetical protein W822_19100 [Advenella kashmirensis W13003]
MKDVLLKLVLSSLAAQLSYGAFAADNPDDDQKRKSKTIQGLTEVVRQVEAQTQGKVVLLTPRLKDGKPHFEMLVSQGGQFQRHFADLNNLDSDGTPADTPDSHKAG